MKVNHAVYDDVNVIQLRIFFYLHLPRKYLSCLNKYMRIIGKRSESGEMICLSKNKRKQNIK